MIIGRKQAVATFLAGILGALPWSKRAVAAPTFPAQPAAPPPIVPSGDAVTIEDLRRRVAALEAALAKQVAFTKDANGNLTLSTTGNVSVNAGASLTLKAAAQGTISSAGTMKIAGATINLN